MSRCSTEPSSDGADSSDEDVLAWDLANVSRVSRPYLNELFDEEVKERVTKALDVLSTLTHIYQHRSTRCCRGSSYTWRRE